MDSDSPAVVPTLEVNWTIPGPYEYHRHEVELVTPHPDGGVRGDGTLGIVLALIDHDDDGIPTGSEHAPCPIWLWHEGRKRSAKGLPRFPTLLDAIRHLVDAHDGEIDTTDLYRNLTGGTPS